MIRAVAVCCFALFTSPSFAAEKPAALTPKEIADGWLLLFDGESTFGWKIQGEAKVKDGVLELGNGKDRATATFTTSFADYDAVVEVQGPGQLNFVEAKGAGTACGIWGNANVFTIKCRCKPGGSTSGIKLKVGADQVSRSEVEEEVDGKTSLQLEAQVGGTVKLKSVKLKPMGTKPLFNGKDLSGWKVFAGDPKRAATKFEVTKDGELSARNGPGDLQTEKTFDNFVLQLECKTNGKWLNSGIFFRCIADQYQNGYECQIQNAYNGEDRTKPIDFGTGAIYRRVPARKVVSNDNEWFTLTLVADGKHFATWVNGYQTIDWTDDRPADENPRKGYRAEKGHLSIQGHDPTTDLLFRNIRIAELPTVE